MSAGIPEFDPSLMPEVPPETFQEVVVDERHMAYAKARWPDSSEKQQIANVRRAIWARVEHARPHPDDPNRRAFGGAQPNSGPKATKPLGAAFVEAFEGRQKEVIDAAASALGSSDEMVRHRAAINILRETREERKMEIVEDEYSRRSDDDVRRSTAKMFVEMFKTGELSMEDIANGLSVEGDAEEIPQAQLAP